MPLIWRSIHHGRTEGGRPIVDKYAIQSGCGRYTVAKVIMGGADWFEAWRVAPNHGSVCLGIERTSDKAKALADADADPPPQASLL